MPALTTEGGFSAEKNVGKPLNDCYGSLTQTAGTEITRVIPPCDEARSCVGAFAYLPAATAHLLTMMTAQAESIVATDLAAAGTVLSVGDNPALWDGVVSAASDWVILQYEDLSWNAHKISSVSGKALTISAVGKKVLANTKVFFMGAPADHSARQFQTVASTLFTFPGGEFRQRAATSSKKASPILFHSPNTTNAGSSQYLAFYFD